VILNDIDIEILKASIESEDIKLLGEHLEAVALLIDQNPFADKIRYLIANQEIRHKAVINKLGKLSPPNCIGTAFFIAGVSEFGCPYHAYGYELDPHFNPTGKEITWMDYHCDSKKGKQPGAFIFSCARDTDDSWHAGIYLGQVNGDHVAFSQHGHGGKFGPELVKKNYESPYYYVPRALLGTKGSEDKTENPGG
jgi:hypothetical protein